jgi:hypothetical protein
MSAKTESNSSLPAARKKKTRNQYCCACSANSRIRQDLIFYGFPKEGRYFVRVVDKNTGLVVKRDRPHVWADFAGVKIEKLRTSDKYICSLHFTPDDFFRTGGFGLYYTYIRYIYTHILYTYIGIYVGNVFS